MKKTSPQAPARRLSTTNCGAVWPTSVTSARKPVLWTAPPSIRLLQRLRNGHAKWRAKTITVALSPEQFASLRQAVANRRTLQKTIAKMEQLSRKILFDALPDTNRRKPLGNKVLGLI